MQIPGEVLEGSGSGADTVLRFPGGFQCRYLVRFWRVSGADTW